MLERVYGSNSCQLHAVYVTHDLLLATPLRQVFGRVIEDGMLVVRKLEAVATGKNNKPVLACVISECGQY